MTETDAPLKWRRKIARNVNIVLVCSAVAFVLSAWAIYSIQQERRMSCERQNTSHDQTLAALDGLLDRAREGASPRRLEQIEQSRTSTALLIAALAPRQDCDEVVGSILPF